MRERQWGFDCVIVLFKREGGVVSARDCYFGITVPPPVHGSSVDLVPHGMEVCDSTEKYRRCLLFVCDHRT